MIVVPERAIPPYSRLPGNVDLDLTYAAAMPLRSARETILRAAACRETYAEIRRTPCVLREPLKLKALLSFVARGAKTRSWLRGFLSRAVPAPPGILMLYTYWLDQATLGLCLARARNARVVSRAHGYDVYEERRRPPYFPCRETTLRMLDRLFVVSDHAQSHIARRFPLAASRVEVSRLGVPDPGVLSRPSTDGTFRLVSCSRLSELKRVGLLLRGLCRLAADHPSVSFHWTHFGAGPQEKAIVGMAQGAPDNLRANLKGWQPNEAVLAFYREQSVDLFITVSSSEGIPVSILEAQSHGVPVLATAVGGCPEVVGPQEGALLPGDPTPALIADSAWSLLTDSEHAARRRAAHRRWRQGYDAQRNLSGFADRLAALCREPPNPARS